MLQIVYGAEVERLFRCASEAQDTTKGMNINDAKDDPQQLVDCASSAATKANQVAAYLNTKGMYFVFHNSTSNQRLLYL